MNVVRRIQTFNAGRDPERLQLKYQALRGSTFRFLRGTCHLFYERLPRGDVFKTAPAVWVCGDLHLENVGSYKADNRLTYFDLNDFDEAALAPASFDLVRYLSSIRIAAEELAIGPDDAQALCQRFLDAYAGALAAGKAYWVERDTASGLVRDLLEGLRGRQRAAFLDARSAMGKGRQRVLKIDGKRALPVSPVQRELITAFMHGFAHSQPNASFYKVLDVARRIAGTGSLGVDRYAILVEGKGSPDGNYLLDLKQALPSCLIPHLRLPQPAWSTEACRVVALQRREQAVSMAFLQPVMMDDRPYVLRGLQPSEDRVALSGSPRGRAGLADLVEVTGRIVAWAQLRSAGRQGSATADELIDFARKRKWKAQLLDASQECVARLHEDATIYNEAFDDGAFRV
nr:DUF2252 family protein [Roseateles aquatilis]